MNLEFNTTTWTAIIGMCAALAACGGGSTGGDTASSMAVDSEASDDAKKQAAALKTSSKAPAPQQDSARAAPGTQVWTVCATEGGSCNYSGLRPVRYGTTTTYATLVLTGPTPCTNAVFGDPVWGTRKTCWVGTTTPANPPSPTPPPPAPAPSPAVAIYHFSDCQTGAAQGCVPGNNANPGTLAAPKQNLAGFNVNAQPAGTQLLFARGGAWNWSNLRLENANATAASPLLFDAYGSGSLPQFNAPNLRGSAIDFGAYNNVSNDGGYTFRNLRLDGKGSSAFGLFLIHNLHHVTIENSEITGFEIAIHSQSRAPFGVTNIVIRNNSISRNGSMGILGQFTDSVIEGNLFEANNFSGSGFNHGTYLSGSADGGRNIVLRNNRYIRNSVLNGVCEGGNMTFHGQMDGVLIEGNVIEQDAGAPGCWAMSITQGYATAEWFRNFVVRNNRIINAGNTAMAVQSAPGIVIEGNVVINTLTTNQTAIAVGNNEYQNGDVPDENAIVRSNTACYPTPHEYSAVVRVLAPGSQVSNNVMLTGAAATAGACAR